MDTEVMAYLLASLVVELVVLAWWFCKLWTSRKQVLERMRQLQRFLWVRPPLFCCKRSEEDRKVAEGIFEFRCWVADCILNYFVVVTISATATVQLNLLTEDAGFLTQGQQWILLFLNLGIMLCKLKPNCLKPLRLYIEYGLVTFCALAYVSKWSVAPAEFSFFSLVAVAVIRMPAVVFATHVWEAFLANLLFFLQALWRGSSEDFGDQPLFTAAFAVRTEFLLLLTVFGFSWIMNRILHARGELEIEHGNVATQLSAASSLLKLTCDAVIELDAELRLQEDSRELAGMLMKNKPGTTMKGCNFLDLMVSEDAVRAMSFLGVAPQDKQMVQSQSSFSSDDGAFPTRQSKSITARAFHTRLVDSYNTKICMEVFQVKYSKLDGSTCNLLGLRDFTDVKSLAGPNADDAMDTSADGNDAVDSFGSLSLPLYMSPRSQSDVDESASPRGEEDEVPARKKEAYLDVDMEGLLVHAASSHLIQLAGKSLRDVFPSPHTSLLLQSLHAEAKFSQASLGRVLTFKDLPVQGLRNGKAASGSMQVMQTRYDQIHVLMVFKEITGRGSPNAGGSPERRGRVQKPSNLSPTFPTSPSLSSL